MKYLFILNDPPCSSERSYNALRLARDLAHKNKCELRLFLLGDADVCAHSGQQVPEGYYNGADMLSEFVRHNATASVCGTCMTVRGIAEGEVVPSATKATMDQLSDWTAWADKVLVF